MHRAVRNPPTVRSPMFAFLSFLRLTKHLDNGDDGLESEERSSDGDTRINFPSAVRQAHIIHKPRIG